MTERLPLSLRGSLSFSLCLFVSLCRPLTRFTVWAVTSVCSCHACLCKSVACDPCRPRVRHIQCRPLLLTVSRWGQRISVCVQVWPGSFPALRTYFEWIPLWKFEIKTLILVLNLLLLDQTEMCINNNLSCWRKFCYLSLTLTLLCFSIVTIGHDNILLFRLQRFENADCGLPVSDLLLRSVSIFSLILPTDFCGGGGFNFPQAVTRDQCICLTLKSFKSTLRYSQTYWFLTGVKNRLQIQEHSADQFPQLRRHWCIKTVKKSANCTQETNCAIGNEQLSHV